MCSLAGMVVQARASSMFWRGSNVSMIKVHYQLVGVYDNGGGRSGGVWVG